MRHKIRKTISYSTLLLAALLLAEPAAAFRCGSKLVKDGMHEQQVIAACDEHNLAMIFTDRRHFRH